MRHLDPVVGSLYLRERMRPMELTLTQRVSLTDAAHCCESCFKDEWIWLFPHAPLAPYQIKDLMTAAIRGGLSLAQESAYLQWDPSPERE